MALAQVPQWTRSHPALPLWQISRNAIKVCIQRWLNCVTLGKLIQEIHLVLRDCPPPPHPSVLNSEQGPFICSNLISKQNFSTVRLKWDVPVSISPHVSRDSYQNVLACLRNGWITATSQSLDMGRRIANDWQKIILRSPMIPLTTVHISYQSAWLWQGQGLNDWTFDPAFADGRRSDRPMPLGLMASN